MKPIAIALSLFVLSPLCAQEKPNLLFIIDPENIKAGIPLEEKTLAEVLKPAGYTSMAVGKWHLGVHPKLHPLKRGFDEFFGFLSGGHDYFPEKLTVGRITDVDRMWGWYRTKILQNNEPVEIDDYLTDELSDAGAAFIERTGKTEKLFFLYLAYNAPHAPMQATEKYLKRFPDIKDKKRRTYAAMVSAMDDGIGRVLDSLEEGGRAENTLVVFISDNGGPESHNASDNGVLRAGKGDPYEGGVRVPFAMRWPAQLEAGQTYEKPIITLDIFATIAEAAGAELDDERPLDGVNLLPYLTGEDDGLPHEQLFWERMNRQRNGMRQGEMKWVDNKGKSQELYNLAEDISEKNDIIAENTEKSEEMQAAWKK
jgi:arylsulfatase A-like enzyme